VHHQISLHLFDGKGTYRPEDGQNTGYDKYQPTIYGYSSRILQNTTFGKIL
jgi:hypothetical protein